MGYCAAFGCNSRQRKGGGVSLHRFPRDAARRSAWEHFCKRKGFVSATHHMLCSKHFSLDMYEYHPLKSPVLGLSHSFHQTPTLKSNAVPDIPLITDGATEAVHKPERSAVTKRRKSEV